MGRKKIDDETVLSRSNDAGQNKKRKSRRNPFRIEVEEKKKEREKEMGERR